MTSNLKLRTGRKQVENADLHTIFPVTSAPGAHLIFKALRCGAYWKAVLKTWQHLFQGKKSYSYEVSKLCYCLFPNNNK